MRLTNIKQNPSQKCVTEQEKAEAVALDFTLAIRIFNKRGDFVDCTVLSLLLLGCEISTG